MSVRIFHGEQQVDAIPVDDRGFAYGDGLFETMRVHAGGVPLWPRHRERLVQGAQRLGLALPGTAVIEARLAESVAAVDAGVLKLIVTRGRGGRGYAPSAGAAATWVLAVHPMPAPITTGLRMHWCETRLASQPALAGIKHCNRLEQVLARAECERAGLDEGLMLDMDDQVACATSANVLALHDGRWTTPSVASCGVAGVCRGWLLDQGLLEVATLSRHQVETADALALCNAVRGILPVSSLGEVEYQRAPDVAALREHLAAAFPMFRMHREVA